MKVSDLIIKHGCDNVTIEQGNTGIFGAINRQAMKFGAPSGTPKLDFISFAEQLIVQVVDFIWSGRRDSNPCPPDKCATRLRYAPMLLCLK